MILAHVASAQGLVAAENVLGENREMDYATVPSAIFTSPEVANVGLPEAQAKEQGCQLRSGNVHSIGPHATDLIAEGVPAIQMGAGVQDLSRTIHAHPMVIGLSQFRDSRKLPLPRLLILPFVGNPGRVPINRH